MGAGNIPPIPPTPIDPDDDDIQDDGMVRPITSSPRDERVREELNERVREGDMTPETAHQIERTENTFPIIPVAIIIAVILIVLIIYLI